MTPETSDAQHVALVELTPAELEIVKAEAAAALQAYLITVVQPIHNFMQMAAPWIEEWLDQIRQVTVSMAELVESLERSHRPPHDRPGWQSPHGPARTKRGRS